MVRVPGDNCKVQKEHDHEWEWKQVKQEQEWEWEKEQEQERGAMDWVKQEDSLPSSKDERNGGHQIGKYDNRSFA